MTQEDKLLDMLQEAADGFGWEIAPSIDEEGVLHGVHMGDEIFCGGMQDGGEWYIDEQILPTGHLIFSVKRSSDDELCESQFYPW